MLDLIVALQQEKPRNPEVKNLMRQLPPELLPPLIPQKKNSQNITSEEWDNLFKVFNNDDFNDEDAKGLKIAFLVAYNLFYPDLSLPMDSPLIEESEASLCISSIEKILREYDEPELVLSFANSLIVYTEEAQYKRLYVDNLTIWLNSFIKNNRLKSNKSEIKDIMSFQYYLLVTLEYTGLKSKGIPQVNLRADLQRMEGGHPFPKEFDNTPSLCPIDEVCNELFKLIDKAENRYGCQVTLELFLPREDLNKNLAKEWQAPYERYTNYPLGTHRPFVVRSWDRLSKKSIQNQLTRNWKLLNGDLQKGCPCQNFYGQTEGTSIN